MFAGDRQHVSDLSIGAAKALGINDDGHAVNGDKSWVLNCISEAKFSIPTAPFKVLKHCALAAAHMGKATVKSAPKTAFFICILLVVPTGG
ncbi:MAG: hypothetical protein AAF583_16890 [Pseudomonadota bacterium]